MCLGDTRHDSGSRGRKDTTMTNERISDRFEYEVLEFRHGGASPGWFLTRSDEPLGGHGTGDLADALNVCGEQGWEAVGVFDSQKLILKRRSSSP
jgi:hypothetical protein